MIAKVAILCVIFSTAHAVTLITSPLYAPQYIARPVLRDESGRYFFGDLPSEGEAITNSLYGGPSQLDSGASALGLAYSVNANQPGIGLRSPTATTFSSPYTPPAAPATTTLINGVPVDSRAASVSTAPTQTVSPSAPLVPQSAPQASYAVPASFQTPAPVTSYNNVFGQGLSSASRYTPFSLASPYTNPLQQGSYISSPYRFNFYGSDNTRSRFL